MILDAWMVVIVALAGWLNREQGKALEYQPPSERYVEANKAFERCTAFWSKLTKEHSADEVRLARGGKGPGAEEYRQYRQTYEDRRVALVELSKAKDLNRLRLERGRDRGRER